VSLRADLKTSRWREKRPPSGDEAVVFPRLWPSVSRSLTCYTGRGSLVLIPALSAWTLVLACGCQRSIEVAQLGARGFDAGGQTSPNSDDARAPDAANCAERSCRGRIMACGNCLDDDLDGLTDALDPDCWGECHDSEATWGLRQVCSNESCYFDRDCGLGNDQACLELTPSGCDCHGCCEVEGRSEPVFLGSRDTGGAPTCNAASVLDVLSCVECVVDDVCFKPCESGAKCFNE
jgi:hypothetical protein